MRTDSVKTASDDRTPHSLPISRRAFIAGSTFLALSPVPSRASEDPHAASRPRSPDDSRRSDEVSPRTDFASPWWMVDGPDRPRVIETRSRRVLTGSRVDEAVLERMIGESVRLQTGLPTASLAWRQLLGSARKILLKFNAADAKRVDTNPAFAAALLGSLAAAGYGPESISAIEIPDDHATRLGVSVPRTTWGESITVAGAPMQIARGFTDADAVINIGLLKWHHIATFSGASINISHGIVRHPARMHGNGCSPFVGDVLAAAPVHSRIRINFVNGIRCILDKGADARTSDVTDYGGIFCGIDPGAVDTAAVIALQSERRKRSMSDSFVVRYLVNMGVRAVCRTDLEQLDQAVGEID